MRTGLRLSLHLLLAGRLGTPTELFARGRRRNERHRDLSGEISPAEPRPAGPLLWVHAAETTSTGAVLALVERLAAERVGTNILLTFDSEPSTEPTGALRAVLPPGVNRRAHKDFLATWRPDVLVWLGEPLRPALLAEVHRQGCPIIGADLTAARSGITSLGLEHVSPFFSKALVRSASDVELLRRATPVRHVFEASAPLREAPAPPPCDHRELDAAVSMVAGRHVWLAKDVTLDEIDLVVAAHAHAARLSHRILMILAPHAEVDPQLGFARCEALGWHPVRRSDIDALADSDQILLADLEGEDGLWFRLAPISFLGSSLVAPGGGSDPWPPASLGSAIIHGPHVQARRADFDRLRHAGAARQVGSAEELGVALGDLQAPDRAAALAHAAWRVASEGAEVTDRIIELAFDALDGAN